MLVAPASLCRLITRLRSEAMTCGPAPVRTWERSSAKVASRTQCRAFSICQCPANPGGKFVGAGLVWGQVGDRVDGLDVPAAPAPGPGRDRPGAADDLDGLAGVGELDPGSDQDDLDAADLAAPVRGLGLAVTGLDLLPGQRGELAPQAGLVALHRQDPVRAAAVQVLDMVALGVQRVCGDHHVGQVDAGQGVEQRCERGDLVGLALNLDLPEHDAGALVDHREQMPAHDLVAPAVVVSGARAGSCRRPRAPGVGAP
jgi:hypothetical protein